MDSDQVNPYQSTAIEGTSRPTLLDNPYGCLGLWLSVIGVVAHFVVPFATPPVALPVARFVVCLAFLSLPGLVLSCVGLLRTPRIVAVCGLLLGLCGSADLGTICFWLSRTWSG